MFCSLNPTSNLCGTQEEEEEKEKEEKEEKEKEKEEKVTATAGKSSLVESGTAAKPKERSTVTAGKQKGYSTVVVRKPICKLTSDMLKGLKVVRMLIQRNKGSWVAICLGSLVDRLSRLEMEDRENQCVRG